MVSFIQSEESSLCACNGKSMTKTSSYEHSNWTVIGANVIILFFFLALAHMLQLLSNSITIFLFDALK